MPALSIYGKTDIKNIIIPRDGETKLGEHMQVADKDWEKELAESPATFVLLGICEDIGVRANGGIGGTGSAWMPFLKSFLNIQHNKFREGASFFLLGAFSWPEFNESELLRLKEQTAAIDEAVYPVIQKIVTAKKIPVVIGGGHNNAYPLLKGASLALGQKINAINLDAHADFRITEGRHSGNGFRYAYDDGFLGKYAMLGLHEAYNNSTIIKEIADNDCLSAIYWEDIFLKGISSWDDAINTLLEHVQDSPFGTELDVDCIENVLSSAITPAGINMQQAMKYLYRCGRNDKALYLHLPEGIYQRADGLEYPLSGKMLNYLVQAFTRGVSDR